MNRKNLLLALAIAGASCHKTTTNNPGNPGTPTGPTAAPGLYTQIDLVESFQGGYSNFIDTTLLNPWGIAVNPAAHLIWTASNHSAKTQAYDSTGKLLVGPIPIPLGDDLRGGSPTGIVFNPTPDFICPVVGGTSKFIFANENGTISAWIFGAAVTHTAVDNSAKGAVYKGLALGVNNGATYLYVTNFSAGTIEVYDNTYKPVTSFPFKDPKIPAGFAPFNIASIKGMLYVTYAKQDADKEDDAPGAGNGFVDVFSTDGNLVQNFAANGPLNSPWGIAQSPDGFGLPLHSIVVGNFGDGMINVYDSTGKYEGALQTGGMPVQIDGLWALDFPINEDPKFGPDKLYFTSGQAGETKGLFGYLSQPK